jgi:hypothetical protein
VRQFATGSDRRSECAYYALTRGLPPKRVGVLLVFLVGLWGPVRAPAQDEPAKGKVARPKAEPTATVPLGKFVPKENLILYVEFAGLDATAAAWKNTAAYRMLTETPLGVMMEQVTTQLLEKTLSLYPNHRLNASELFSLIKHSVQSGWVLAIHANPKSSDGPLRGTLVVRSAAGKEFRVLSAQTMGWMMGDAKPKGEWKTGRMMVAVPAPAPAAPAAGASAGWVWWAEKEDLVISFPGPSSGDAVIAALDGKAPCALEHPLYQALSKPEGGFQPVCFAFADTANCPAIPTRLTELLHTMGAEWGVQRIDARLGFEGDALVTVTRVTAPKPRRGPLALFNQPTFERSALLPLPTGVDSLVALSMNPARVLEALYAADTSDTIKTQVEELAKSIRRGGKIDLERDLLAHLGPKMVFFLAPERSAATNDESAESALKKGFSLLALATAMQSVLPKLTLVAEVDNPESVGKALDAVVVAANLALKARAHELADEERAAAAREPEGGARPPGPGGARAGGAGARGKRRRPEDTPAPQFMPVLGHDNAFVLTTPRDSALKLGPSHFRPTIQLEGKYLVISTSSDAVRTALTALQRKDGKPSEEVQKACAAVPSGLIALGVNDVRDGLSSVLASWPGTLQATVNTAIALSRPRSEAEKSPAGGGAGQQPGLGASMAGGRARGMGAAGVLSRAAPGGGPAAERERGSSSGPNRSGNAPGTPGASGSGGDDMVQLNVDADKLPKADDLKKLLSASIAFINVSDEEVRFTTRTAFPNLGLPIQVAPLLASTPLGQRIREALVPGQGTNPDQSSPASGGASPGATGTPPGGQAGTPPAAPPGKPRGGRRGGND